MPAIADIQRHLGDDFTLERELGGGGMSRVYVAYDRRLERRVAIKVLRPELAAGVSLERFRREIKMAASLQHPLIVPVLDVGELDGLPYFLMPFVEGESLRTRLGRGRLSIIDTVRILRDVARALAVAHSRGVVHRDIKPDNVLLANDAAVVADFGVAKAFERARHGGSGEFTAPPTHTTEGMSLGTPAYMAPEQVAADPQASFPVDIYAVGVLAYEMLVGTPPFSGRSPQQVMAAHIAELPVPVAQLRPDTPPALAALVMQCLEKDPARRPVNAAALVDALEDPQVVSGSFTPVLDDGTGQYALRALSGAQPAAHNRGVGTWPRVAFAAVGAVVVASLAWYAGLRDGEAVAGGATNTNARTAPAAVPDTTPSVAVLPFAYLSADSSQRFTAAAITEAITSALSLERGLRVSSGAASEALQRRLAEGDTSRTPVQTLVEGVVEVQQNRVRLTVRLVDARTGFTLFADRLEGSRTDLFAMEDTVADAMRELLRGHFALASPDSAKARAAH
ncbi:protein kinase domain-containing protein [Gemmatimonas sp.]|uniref:protein kinase domain-containing protein n=1 Tax=Gemmatimonas sp. TaxID=1962908 RepID=UPI003DA27847